MNKSELGHLRGIGLGVLIASGTVLGVTKLSEVLQVDRPLPSKDEESVSIPQSIIKQISDAKPSGALVSSDKHFNLVGMLFEARGEGMFVPSLAQQAKQGGATLLEVIKLSPDQQVIPIENVGFVKRRIPGPDYKIFPVYESVTRQENEMHVIATARTINDTTGKKENYFLLKDACLVYEMPSTEHNRQLLQYFPAALDIRTKILFPQACWILERTASYNWIRSSSSDSPK